MTAAPAPKRARVFHLARPVVREHPLHVQIAALLTLELARAGHSSPAGVLWFSVEHAHYAGIPGTRTARGVVAGVPDVQILYNGRAYFLEIKAADGRLSAPQVEMHAALATAGCPVAVVRSAEDVLHCLHLWAIPRRHRVIT